MMPRIGPLGRWQALVDAGRLSDDPVQRAAAGRLQALHEALAAAPADAPAKPRRSFLRRRQDRTPATSPRGLYLYGPVGRGKSMLMDLFFEDAPVARKRRVHFHAFMQEVHTGITEARQQGLRDPVARVAGAVARQAALLCFDE
ncbi:MAG: cell division protein ZapE, partial [Alphaproteobacteria bacterium]